MALTPDERHAITDLFDRMRENGLAEKDAEAEALINQLARRTPDSLYMLAQSVLIQEAQIAEYEEYMDQQEARIKELEAQLAGGRGGSSPGTSTGGGGFLGGRGVSRSAPVEPMYDDRRGGGSGIPPIGSRSSGPSPYGAPQAPVGTPWSGRPHAAGPAAPMDRPQPMPQQPAQASGGGGFLKTAAVMAAGVAGGALLGNALGGMFGGNKGEAQAGQGSSSTGNEGGGFTSADNNDPGNYDASTHDAGYEEGGDWGVGGGGDGGIEI